MRRWPMLAGVMLTCMLATYANAHIYDLQERCGLAAERAFAKDNPTGQFYNSGDTFSATTFTSHYNTRLRRCLVMYNMTFTSKKDNESHDSSYSYIIFDPIENKEYAQYTNMIYQHTKILMVCYVEKTKCTTQDQWKAPTNSYMEE